MGILTELWAGALFKATATAVPLLVLDWECEGSPLVSCESRWSFPTAVLTVALLISLLAFPSGGQLNTTISFGLMGAGMQTPLYSIILTIAQVIAAALAMHVLHFLLPLRLHGFVRPPSPRFALPVAFAHEMFFCFVNVFSALATAVCGRYQAPVVSAFVAVEIIVGRAGMDPSAAFAAAYFSGNFTFLFEIYWIASILGGFLAGLAWRFLEDSLKKTSKGGKEE